MFPKAIRSRLSISLFINRRGDLVAYEGRPWRRTADNAVVPGSDDISLEFIFGEFQSVKFVVVTKRGTKGGPGWEHSDLMLRGEVDEMGIGLLTGPGGIKIECQGFDEQPIKATEDNKDRGVKKGDIIGYRLLVAALPSQAVIKEHAQPRQAKVNYNTGESSSEVAKAPAKAPRKPALATANQGVPPKDEDTEEAGGKDEDIPF